MVMIDSGVGGDGDGDGVDGGGSSEAYLILVTTSGGVLFSCWRTFFHIERRRDCFRKVYSENINTNL